MCSFFISGAFDFFWKNLDEDLHDLHCVHSISRFPAKFVAERMRLPANFATSSCMFPADFQNHAGARFRVLTSKHGRLM